MQVLSPCPCQNVQFICFLTWHPNSHRVPSCGCRPCPPRAREGGREPWSLTRETGVAACLPLRPGQGAPGTLRAALGRAGGGRGAGQREAVWPGPDTLRAGMDGPWCKPPRREAWPRDRPAGRPGAQGPDTGGRGSSRRRQRAVSGRQPDIAAGPGGDPHRRLTGLSLAPPKEVSAEVRVARPVSLISLVPGCQHFPVAGPRGHSPKSDSHHPGANVSRTTALPM